MTLRKRKLPLESMVWLVIGMAIFDNKPLAHIGNLMDIVDRTGRSYTAPGSVIARRKTLGEDAIRELFNLTQKHWHEEARHPLWNGLTLNAVDGVVWRPPPRGFWSTGLLHDWHCAGENRHWLLPLKRGTKYEVVRRLGKEDELITLKTSPQARKQWAGLPDTLTVRLIRRKVNGMERQLPVYPPQSVPATGLVPSTAPQEQ